MTLVIAHRGASVAERENTLSAFRRAVEMGAEGIELDVRRTADRHLVVHHDPLVAGRVIGEAAHAELPGWVPTLADALDACAGAFVNVEIKNIPGESGFDPDEAVTEQVLAELDRRGDPRRWLISSFHAPTVERCRQLRPSGRTALLVVQSDPSVVDDVVAVGHEALHPWVDELTESTVRACHAAGLAVNVWTCDDSARMRELIAWGVNGICTNVPDVALAVRRELLGESL